jgi:hypothetical protein
MAFEAPVPADLERLWEETTKTGFPPLPRESLRIPR